MHVSKKTGAEISLSNAPLPLSPLIRENIND
jgi:hypothetical protein